METTTGVRLSRCNRSHVGVPDPIRGTAIGRFAHLPTRSPARIIYDDANHQFAHSRYRESLGIAFILLAGRRALGGGGTMLPIDPRRAGPVVYGLPSLRRMTLPSPERHEPRHSCPKIVYDEQPNDRFWQSACVWRVAYEKDCMAPRLVESPCHGHFDIGHGGRRL